MSNLIGHKLNHVSNLVGHKLNQSNALSFKTVQNQFDGFTAQNLKNTDQQVKQKGLRWVESVVTPAKTNGMNCYNRI